MLYKYINIQIKTCETICLIKDKHWHADWFQLLTFSMCKWQKDFRKMGPRDSTLEDLNHTINIKNIINLLAAENTTRRNSSLWLEKTTTKTKQNQKQAISWPIILHRSWGHTMHTRESLVSRNKMSFQSVTDQGFESESGYQIPQTS